MVASLIFITACKDDIDPEIYAPKLYLYSPLKSGITAKSEVVRSPTATIMPNDEQEFKVYLSKEVDHDITITAVESPTLAKTYNKDAIVLPEGSVDFVENNVIIKAGQTVSSSTIKVRLKQNNSIEQLEGDGIIALQITNPNGIATEENRQAFYWTVAKRHRNIFVGTEEGMLPMVKNNFILTSSKSALLRRLTDGRNNNAWSAEAGDYIQAKFNQPTILKGVAVFPYFNRDDLQGCPKILELQVSNDAKQWKTLGQLEFELPAIYGPMMMQLFAPVETQYARVILIESFAKDNNGNNTTIRLVECKFYQ